MENFLHILTGPDNIMVAAMIQSAAAAGLALHFWRIRKDGGISGPL